MHTDLRIDVEVVDADVDGAAEAFIIRARGHGPNQRCVAASPADVKAIVDTIVDKWAAHNVSIERAQTGASIERRGVVG